MDNMLRELDGGGLMDDDDTMQGMKSGEKADSRFVFEERKKKCTKKRTLKLRSVDMVRLCKC
jgi:hypothetical protein